MIAANNANKFTKHIIAFLFAQNFHRERLANERDLLSTINGQDKFLFKWSCQRSKNILIFTVTSQI